jgi:HAD superfamily hydrolase (TIGR01509 family)
MPSSPQAVIFDLDGVLIDSHPVALAMMRECAARNSIPLDDDDYRAWLFMSARPFWEAMRHKYALPQAVDFYLADYNVEEEIRRYIQLEPIPGVVGLVERLTSAGVPLAVATSASHRRAAAVISQFGLAQHFATIVAAADVTNHKPHPEVYLEAARRADVAPPNCVAIEDTASGVEAARGAGMRTVGYTGPGSAGQELRAADLIVDDFSALPLDLLWNQSCS